MSTQWRTIFQSGLWLGMLGCLLIGNPASADGIGYDLFPQLESAENAPYAASPAVLRFSRSCNAEHLCDRPTSYQNPSNDVLLAKRKTIDTVYLGKNKSVKLKFTGDRIKVRWYF